MIIRHEGLLYAIAYFSIISLVINRQIIKFEQQT